MKRVTLFCGHYGSGKTNISINYAFYIKSTGKNVAIADLDIVNPYFRTADSKEEFNKAGIDFISLPYANTNVDLPSLPSEAYSLVQNKKRYAVIDVGGDERGALALGRFVPAITEENNFENIFVVNFKRPLCSNAEEALEIMKEIKAASGLPFTAIVNNTNLGDETSCEIIEKSLAEAERLSSVSGLPVIFTSVKENLNPKMTGKIFKLHLQKKPWDADIL